MADKTKQIGVRIDEETSARLDAFTKQTDIEGAALARHAIKAALQYWEEHKGAITMPLVCLPKAEYERLRLKATM